MWWFRKKIIRLLVARGTDALYDVGPLTGGTARLTKGPGRPFKGRRGGGPHAAGPRLLSHPCAGSPKLRGDLRVAPSLCVRELSRTWARMTRKICTSVNIDVHLEHGKLKKEERTRSL